MIKTIITAERSLRAGILPALQSILPFEDSFIQTCELDISKKIVVPDRKALWRPCTQRDLNAPVWMVHPGTVQFLSRCTDGMPSRLIILHTSTPSKKDASENEILEKRIIKSLAAISEDPRWRLTYDMYHVAAVNVEGYYDGYIDEDCYAEIAGIAARVIRDEKQKVEQAETKIRRMAEKGEIELPPDQYLEAFAAWYTVNEKAIQPLYLKQNKETKYESSEHSVGHGR